MNTADFPFDVQTCHITAGSWIYDSKQLKLSLMDPPVLWSAHAGEWKLSGTQAVIKELPYSIFFDGK